jgi:hypothetical protein
MATTEPPCGENGTTYATGGSISSLVGGIVEDAQQLFKQQLALLKHDIRTDVRQVKEATISLAAGGAIAALGILHLSVGIVLLLNWLVPALPLWAWFLIAGGLVTLIGGILAYAGIRRFAELNPLPENSVHALRENMRWTTRPTSSANR